MKTHWAALLLVFLVGCDNGEGTRVKNETVADKDVSFTVECRRIGGKAFIWHTNTNVERKCYVPGYSALP